MTVTAPPSPSSPPAQPARMDSGVPGCEFLGVGVARLDDSAAIGKGGCGVAGVRETLRWRRGGGAFSSSAFVSTEGPFAVSVLPPPATRDRRFGVPIVAQICTPPRRAVRLGYIGKRFDAPLRSSQARRKSSRRLGSALREAVTEVLRSGSVGLWGDVSSTATTGGSTGLSTRE